MTLKREVERAMLGEKVRQGCLWGKECCRWALWVPARHCLFWRVNRLCSHPWLVGCGANIALMGPEVPFRLLQQLRLFSQRRS